MIRLTCRCACASLQATLEASNGVLRLPLIKNKKTVNPRDSSSAKVGALDGHLTLKNLCPAH